MNTKDFFFELPHKQIAQEPVSPRDASRLMHLDKQTGALQHKHFYDVIDFLQEGDVLVANNSKVIPARLYGEKKHTGGKCELLLLKEIEKNIWECIAKPGRRLTAGVICIFGDGILEGEVIETLSNGNKSIKFSHNYISIYEVLDLIGLMPLPHYITKELKDNNQYQTVYAKEKGSAAAPTAGLHFTEDLLRKIKEKGVIFTEATLHVGIGTFRPVQVEDIAKHEMHAEWYSISEETAQIINHAKEKGRKVIAVGTTSCRTLESTFQKNGKIKEDSGDTNIFITPGYEFKVLDGLITNFHLPESTLIMLVSALAGYEHTMSAYKVAVEEKYRFFSFGDAMLIL